MISFAHDFSRDMNTYMHGSIEALIYTASLVERIFYDARITCVVAKNRHTSTMHDIEICANVSRMGSEASENPRLKYEVTFRRYENLNLILRKRETSVHSQSKMRDISETPGIIAPPHRIHKRLGRHVFRCGTEVETL